MTKAQVRDRVHDHDFLNAVGRLKNAIDAQNARDPNADFMDDRDIATYAERIVICVAEWKG